MDSIYYHQTGGVSKSSKHSLHMNHHPQRHADLGEQDLVVFFLSFSSNVSCSLKCLTSSSWNSAQCDTCMGGQGMGDRGWGDRGWGTGDGGQGMGDNTREDNSSVKLNTLCTGHTNMAA